MFSEWRHGRGGHLILADEDLTTKVVNGWKRINTLAHYGIRESAVMCLVARRKEMLNCLRKFHFIQKVSFNELICDIKYFSDTISVP